MTAGPEDVSPSLERVLHRFATMLHHVGKARGLSGAEADELCQEVRIRLWRALKDGDRIAAAQSSYVYRTALTAATDLIRRRRARPTEPLGDGLPSTSAGAVDPATDGAADSALDDMDLAERIGTAVGRLHPPRDVVVRLHLAGYDRREIAGFVGWTESKTRNLLYRGLDDLREILGGMGIGPEQTR